MPKQFLLIRHGEGIHQTEHLVGGWTDVDLTELGQIQAELTAKRVAKLIGGDNSSVRLISSDLKRAKHTAIPISELLDIPLDIDTRIREISRGNGHDLSKKEANSIAIPISEPLLDWKPYPEAESWRMFQDRIYPVYEEYSKLKEDILIIVSHSQTQVCFTQAHLDIPRDFVYRLGLKFANCSITQLSVNQFGEPSIDFSNDTCHLTNL